MAFVTYDILNIDFTRIMQLLSYIGVILILVFRKSDNPIKFPSYLFFYLLFILYVFYSAFYQLDRTFKVSYLFSNRLIGAFNFMFIIENLKISKKHYELLIKISTRVLVIAVLVILIQQTINKNFFIRKDLIEAGSAISGSKDRLNSIYSWIGTNVAGFGFVPVFIIIIEYLDKKKKKILGLIMIGVVFAVLTKARWIMVNTLLVFVLLFVNHKNKSLIFFKYLTIIPMILVVMFFALNSVGIDSKKIVEDRILESDKKDISKKSAGTRLLAIKVFNKLYWYNPIFGKGSIKYGMGGTGKQDYELKKALAGHSSQLHVGYLSVLYMYGILGASFFFIFLILLIRKLYKDAKKTGYWAPLLGALGFVLANVTLVTFNFFQMGLLLSLVVNTYYLRNKNMITARIHA